MNSSGGTGTQRGPAPRRPEIPAWRRALYAGLVAAAVVAILEGLVRALWTPLPLVLRRVFPGTSERGRHGLARRPHRPSARCRLLGFRKAMNQRDWSCPVGWRRTA